MRFLAPSRPPPLLNPYCSGLGKGALVVEYAIKARNLSGESKKVFLAARKATAAQRKNPKTPFFGFFPRIPARTAG